MSAYMNNMQPEAWREIMQQQEEQMKLAEAFNRGKQKLFAPPAPSHQQIANDILRQMLATLQRIEQGLSAMKLTGIPVKGIRKTKDGKIAKVDKAPTQVKQGRRRKKNTVTRAKPAR